MASDPMTDSSKASTSLHDPEFWRMRRDVFVECLSDYERLRGYLVCRYNDNADNREIGHWMQSNNFSAFRHYQEVPAWPT